MFNRLTLLASAFGVLAMMAVPARAFVVYSVVNPSNGFAFFAYDSPTFITTDTLVPASALAFNNTVHAATSVDFILSSRLDPGFADVQISIDPAAAALAGIPAVQDKFVPATDLTQYGNYQAASGSYGFPNTFVDVTAPEPASLSVLGAGLLGLFGLRRGYRKG